MKEMNEAFVCYYYYYYYSNCVTYATFLWLFSSLNTHSRLEMLGRLLVGTEASFKLEQFTLR